VKSGIRDQAVTPLAEPARNRWGLGNFPAQLVGVPAAISYESRLISHPDRAQLVVRKDEYNKNQIDQESIEQGWIFEDGDRRRIGTEAFRFAGQGGMSFPAHACHKASERSEQACK